MNTAIEKPRSSENSAIEAFYSNRQSLREKNLEKAVYLTTPIIIHTIHGIKVEISSLFFHHGKKKLILFRISVSKKINSQATVVGYKQC